MCEQVEYATYVRACNTTGTTNLNFELLNRGRTGRDCGMNGFYRDTLAEFGVVGLIYLSHSTPRNEPDNLKAPADNLSVAKGSAGEDRHGERMVCNIQRGVGRLIRVE